MIRDHLKRDGLMKKCDVIKIVKKSIEVLKAEGNVIQIADPVTIVGDLHGQFYDLLKLLSIAGNPETNKYLFLGDYVDRGIFSIEVMVLLLSIKINKPSLITLLRGNHECRQMTAVFNFREECLAKFDQEVYDVFLEMFDCLPISAIINGKFIAFHGGISPELKTIADLNKVDRFKEPPPSGLICDLLWSDPVDRSDGFLKNDFVENDQRGCSFFYGQKSLNAFLTKNNLLSVIRGHEVQLEGYKLMNWKSKAFPQVITIFSAPNYCDSYNNKGAIIKFENNSLNIQQFHYSQYPYFLPNYMNLFEWSLPFVAEKVNEILNDIVSQKDVEDEEDESTKEKARQLASIKARIRFIGKMACMQKVLREEREQILKIKEMNNEKLPVGLLMEGKEVIQNFSSMKVKDAKNEMRPGSCTNL